MFGVVDRFENDLIVIETDEGKMLNCKRSLFPKKIREGDVVNLKDFTINKEETEKRRESIDKLFEDLLDE